MILLGYVLHALELTQLRLCGTGVAKLNVISIIIITCHGATQPVLSTAPYNNTVYTM